MTHSKSFHLYGFTVTADMRGLVGIREERIGNDRGSSVIASEMTGDRWPNNNRGGRAAAKWTLEMNIAESNRIGSHDRLMAEV